MILGLGLLAAAGAAAVIWPPDLDPFRRHHRTMAALAAVTRTDTSNEGDEK